MGEAETMRTASASDGLADTAATAEDGAPLQSAASDMAAGGEGALDLGFRVGIGRGGGG